MYKRQISSRELKDYEAELLETKSIGRDAIAIVVNKENPVESLTAVSYTHLPADDFLRTAPS